MAIICRSKDDFLGELRRGLRKLSQEDAEDAVAYFDEYIEDAGEENLAATLEALGPPRKVALLILRDRAISDIETSPASPKKGLSATWTVVAALMASPVALPLAVAVAIVAAALVLVLVVFLLCMLLVLFCVVFALGITAIACLASSAVSIALSIPLMFQHLATGFFLLGASLAMLGLGLLAAIGTVRFTKFAFLASRELLGRRLPRFVGRILTRKGDKHERTQHTESAV